METGIWPNPVLHAIFMQAFAAGQGAAHNGYARSNIKNSMLNQAGFVQSVQQAVNQALFFQV